MNSDTMFKKIGYELEEDNKNFIVYIKYTDISETQIVIDKKYGVLKKKKRYKWDTYLTWYIFTAPEISACAKLIQERNIKFEDGKMY